MRHVLIAIAAGGVLRIGMAEAMPPALAVPELLRFCASASVTEAAAVADGLGWRRMGAAQVEGWRTAYVAANGGPVDVLAWRRGEDERDGALSFWVAGGDRPHRACSYSVAGQDGLLDVLTERFGTPLSLDRLDAVAAASWKAGSTEVGLSQVGTTTLVRFIHYDIRR